ncbi:hypothetical protein BEP19_14675 [Ammoniphilus oxalaticus]|uniref:Uncharacterized protein n=1 Tax=Ammoniphilus oxalaticus TaxID=66863 RepID=A0A419SF06_9BACL|nr:hypothetical protein BEP19_14675 [Ammoniphilus oxalaticus]
MSFALTRHRIYPHDQTVTKGISKIRYNLYESQIGYKAAALLAGEMVKGRNAFCGLLRIQFPKKEVKKTIGFLHLIYF